MITFWVNAAGRFGIEHYRATRAQHLADRIEVRCYEALSPTLAVRTGSHIFASLDQLTPSGLDAAASLYTQLAGRTPAGGILNEPGTVPLRSALLGRLFDAGVNQYAARRATDPLESIRFPVFVREDASHDGPLTGLLPDGPALGRALRGLGARGFQRADLLVVEFCDLSGADGMIRTAAALKVGEHIVPSHLLCGRHWLLKWDGSDKDERAMEAHLSYIRTNPHQAWVRKVFELAGVDYGRLDYGVRGETLQAWEINTNPTLGPSPDPVEPFPPRVEALLREARAIHHDALRAAFGSLDRGADRDRLTLHIAPALLTRMRSEAKRTARRGAFLRFLRRLYAHPLIGRPFRAAYAALVPLR